MDFNQEFILQKGALDRKLRAGYESNYANYEIN